MADRPPPPPPKAVSSPNAAAIIPGAATPALLPPPPAFVRVPIAPGEYYRVDVVGENISVDRSALQKAIRRNDAKTASYYAMALLASHKIENLHNRLLVAASEDIGPANNNAIILALSRYKRYQMIRKNKPKEWKNLTNRFEIRSNLLALIKLMCVSPKSRAADHLCIAVLEPLSKGQQIPTTVPVTRFMALVAHMLHEKASNTDFVSLLKQRAKAAVAATDPGRALVFNTLAEAQELRGEKTNVFLGHACLVEAESTSPPSSLVFVPWSVATDTVARAEAAQADPMALICQIMRNQATKLSAPPYSYDMHVAGRQSELDVRLFIETEHAALTPKATTFVDKYYEHAAGYGAMLRASLSAVAKGKRDHGASKPEPLEAKKHK